MEILRLNQYAISNLNKLFKLIAGLTASYFFYKVGKFYLFKRKYRHIPGPATNGMFGFFLGNIADIKKLQKEGKVFADYLVDCHQKYGEVFKFQLLGDVIICTSNREAIRDILITKNFPKNKKMNDLLAFPLKTRLLGYGLVTDLDHQRWKHRRSLFNPGFHKNVLITFIDQFNVKADILMDRLRSMADGKTIVLLLNELNNVALDAIVQIAFGMNIDSINGKDPELSIAIEKLLKIIQKNLINPFYKYKLSSRKEIKHFDSLAKFIRNVGEEKLLERIKSLKNKEYVPTDILSSILKNWKDNDMELDSLIDDFVTFLIAGQETTANTLASSFLEIGKNKEIFKKAREEIDRVLGERNEITYQDAIDLKYCNSILKEALRLYPPVASVLRQSTEEIIINGYTIPEGSFLDVSTYLCSRCEKNFPNPFEFKPERFMKHPDSLENNVENYTYFPFGLGARNCIGQNFAQIEGVILIAKIIKNFDFELDPYQSFSITQEFTLKPKDGTKCTFTLRN